MKNFTRIFGGLLASVIIFSTCSCSSRSSHIDPDAVPRVPQNTAIITPQDLVQAAQLAAASILQDKKMNNYLAEYKKQKGDPNAVPVLDCRIFNQMNNPDFVATPFLTTFESAVRDSKKYNLVRDSNSSIQGKKQKPDLIFRERSMNWWNEKAEPGQSLCSMSSRLTRARTIDCSGA